MNVHSWAQRASNQNEPQVQKPSAIPRQPTQHALAQLAPPSTIPLLQSNALSAVVQQQIFSKTQEDVLCTIHVVPDTTSPDVVAKSTTTTSPFLIAISVTRTKSGYKDPKIHEIKAKLSGDLMLKTSRSLKSIERVVAPNGFKEMISFVGNDGKKTTWAILAVQMITHKVQSTFTTNSSIRDEFIWWASVASTVLSRTELVNSMDISIHNAIFQRFTKILSCDSNEVFNPITGVKSIKEDQSLFQTNFNPDLPSGASFTSLQRYLVNALVEKKRLQAETSQQQANASRADPLAGDLLLLPDMSSDEAQTLSFFIEQGGLSISRIGELEAYLQDRLISLQQETIKDVFQSHMSHNSLLLSSLLDRVLDHLEEIDSWTQTYDATISIMSQGISKIEKQSEVLVVEDNNYSNLVLVLLWVLTEITLPTKTYSLLQDRRFPPSSLEPFVRACLLLDGLLTSTRLTADNAALLQSTKPTLAKEQAKRRIKFPFRLGKRIEEDDEEKKLEVAVNDDLDVLLTGNQKKEEKVVSTSGTAMSAVDGKSNTSTGQVEKGRFERRLTNNTAAPTTIQTAGGGTSSVAAALQAAGINLASYDTSLQSNTDLKVVMEQKTEEYRQGLIDFTKFSGLAAVIQKKKEFRLLASSTANAINTKVYNLMDQLVLKYSEYPISDKDQGIVRAGDVNQVMYCKLNYKLSIEKYNNLHKELLQYKSLVGICERLSPGYLQRFREQYCQRFAAVYKADIDQFFDKLRRVIHGSSVDCRLRHSPSVNLNDLQAMANIYRDAVMKGQKADKKTTQTLLGMKSKIFHTEQLSAVQPAPPGKMYASDVYKYALDRVMEIVKNEQLFLLNMFIIWEETDIKMMYRSLVENPLIEMGKKYLLYPDKTNPEWLKMIKYDQGYRDREKEMLLLFKGVPLQIPSCERSEANLPSIPPQTITSAQTRTLSQSMSQLLSPLITGLQELVTLGDKLDHFCVINMLVHSERTITQATPRNMWKENKKQLKLQQKQLAELERKRLQNELNGQPANQDGGVFDVNLFHNGDTALPPVIGGKQLANNMLFDLPVFDDTETDSSDYSDSDYSDSDGSEDSRETPTSGRLRKHKKALEKPVSEEQAEATRNKLNTFFSSSFGFGGPGVENKSETIHAQTRAVLNSYTVEDYFFTDARVTNYIGIEFLVTILTQVISVLKLKWNSFIDKEVLWIDTYKVNPKQEGVLEPFSRFPAFIERLEAVCYPTHSLEADHAYVKISVALLRWLSKVAKLNTKYENTIVYENSHYYCQSIGSRRPQLTCLESNLFHARHLFLSSRTAYVRWNIEYEMPVWIAFCQKLFHECKLHLPTNTLPQVPLLSGLSKDVLRKLFRDQLSPKQLEVHASTILKRLQRQLPYNQLLVRETYLFIREHALALTTQFLKAVELCYLHEHVPLTLETIHIAFNNVLSLEAIATSVQNAYQLNSTLQGRQGVENTQLAGHGMLRNIAIKQTELVAEKQVTIKKEPVIKKVELPQRKPSPPRPLPDIKPKPQPQPQSQPKQQPIYLPPPPSSSEESTEESSSESSIEEYESEESEEIFEFVVDESVLEDLHVDTTGREVYAETVQRKGTKETTHKEWESGWKSGNKR